MVEVRVKVKGITPIMMDKPSDTLVTELVHKIHKKANTDRTDEEMCEERIYRNEEGQPGIPQEMLLPCLIGGGKFVKYDPKRNISNAKESLLPGLILIRDFFMPFTNGAKWKVDKRIARNPQDGVAIGKIRPKFDTWDFVVNLEVDETQIQVEKIKEVFKHAGRKCGLGSFRPQKKGPFGQFVVESWEELGNGKTQ